MIALNDIVIARGALARVCRLDVSIDDSHLATFIADGLVVASPTGSTGYSFSAGGPIVEPQSRNLIVTPIAGYLSAIRSVVAGPTQTVRCRIVDAHEALVSIDGREDIKLAVGDVVAVRAVERPIRLVEPQGTLSRSGTCSGTRSSCCRRDPSRMTDSATAGRLLELTVTDLALIDRLRLELGPGLNVITGETGAGKSLLIDALGLALGARADTTLVRHGAELARVEALFDRIPEPVIAVREVAATGRSTARLDDETVTAARLAEEVGPLVEIHGQHEQQRLLDERWQRDLLDAFGGHEQLRDEMATRSSAGGRTARRSPTLSIDPRELAAGSSCSSTRPRRLPPRGSNPARRTSCAGDSRRRSTARPSPEGAIALRDALVAEGVGHGTPPPSLSAKPATLHGWTPVSNRSSTGSRDWRPRSRTPPARFAASPTRSTTTPARWRRSRNGWA